MTFRETIARAMYDTNKFVTPWDHPNSKRIWHPICYRYADAVIAEIKKESRRQAKAAKGEME